MAGFILTPFFSEALPLYEKQETAMRMYFPDMMASMDLKKESKRLDACRSDCRPSKASQAAVERDARVSRASRRRKRSKRRRSVRSAGFRKGGRDLSKGASCRPNESRSTRGFTMD